MADIVVWEDAIGGVELIAPARSSEKDLYEEQVGLEATGLATTTLSASSISIMNCYVSQCMILFARFSPSKTHKGFLLMTVASIEPI